MFPFYLRVLANFGLCSNYSQKITGMLACLFSQIFANARILVNLALQLLRSGEARTHTNHVDFESIYIETYRKSSMPSYFRVFWKEASLSCYCRAKGRYRKKNCSNFENSNQLERKLGSFFYSATLFSQFLTKQKCL